MLDLWPDDLDDFYNKIPAPAKTPKFILEEQSSLIGRKTGNFVEGLVDPEASRDLVYSPFAFSFYFVAPALDYHYKVLEIRHSSYFYPLSIGVDDDILAGLPAEMKGTIGHVVANSEDRFIEILRAIFTTEKVRSVIQAIIAQSAVKGEMATEVISSMEAS